jgi:predicted transcriptional regulator
MAMTLRIDDELESALQALVAAEGVSRQEVVKRAVLEMAERHGHIQRVAASADALAERWGDVLHRLGTV